MDVGLSTIQWSVHEGVGVCQFNRPKVRNALNKAMVQEIANVLRDASQDPAVQFVIFTGDDKAFISGADIREMAQRGRDDALAMINSTLCFDIERFPKPTIAAVEGFALGGGCELAMACDLRVCGASAQWGQPEVTLGIIPGAGATYRLARLVGMGRAKDMIYTGRRVGAAEALQMGLVNRVVSDGDAVNAARDLIAEMRKATPVSLRLAKWAIHDACDVGNHCSMQTEALAQAVLFDDEEKRNRMLKF